MNFVCDNLGDFSLKRENLSKIAIETTGPNLTIRMAVDETQANPQSVFKLLYGALQQRINSQFLSNIRQCCLCGTVLSRRGP